MSEKRWLFWIAYPCPIAYLHSIGAHQLIAFPSLIACPSRTVFLHRVARQRLTASRRRPFMSPLVPANNTARGNLRELIVPRIAAELRLNHLLTKFLMMEGALCASIPLER